MTDQKTSFEKIAVVTGGARGIGAAISRGLALQGCDVAVMGRNKEQLSAFCQELSSETQRKILPVVVDVSDPEAVAKAFGIVSDELGAPTFLINNAGIAPAAPFMKTDLATWNKVLGVDLTGVFLCTQQVLPAMIKAKDGRIVNVASTAGLKGYAYTTAYCAAKHGLIGLTRSLALETTKTGVTVNAVCPGFTDTELVAEAVQSIAAKTGRTSEEAVAELAANNPQGRLIDPQEVAEAVLWLCQESSGSITGQSIAVAGGEVM
ncbi:MAG: SDR family oxidoreductase [Rhodospirillales bacterium]|nr:SDR family oxidoreductase [Rhodospirillales bacterium]